LNHDNLINQINHSSDNIKVQIKDCIFAADLKNRAMPKVLLYITSKITWIFLFYGTDANENRAHVHIGKKDSDQYCKIWLEPEVAVAKNGSLTDAELKQVLKLTAEYQPQLLKQWQKFKAGTTLKMITVNK
jgi:hypothetical protein